MKKPTEVAKVEKTSEDMLHTEVERLSAVFPQFVKDGAVDLDTLREFFGEEGVLAEAGQERYGLSWKGKSDALKAIRVPATGTLAPQEEVSKDWDKTENVFIEGDNLEVLKLLQRHYRSQIKMIYIDPPYNTGKDFIYKDNFTENKSDYYERTGQRDDGVALTSNPETNGRYHSDWLTMMYPRLFLARQLLRDDGVIFISINDYEMANLRLICNDIFGEENSLTESPTALVWQGSGTTAGHFANSHEYILGFAKDKNKLPFFSLEEYGDENIIAHGALKKISKANPASAVIFPAGIEFEGISGTFKGEIGGSEKEIIEGDMIFKDGKLTKQVTITAGWAMRDSLVSWLGGEETFDTKGQKIIRFYFNKEGILWYEKERGTIHPRTVLDQKVVGTTKQGSSELSSLLGLKAFEFPKPSSLIQFLVSFTTRNNDMVLDFFAGSGTTAHAVFAQNAEDDGNRKWISVQIPEATAEDSEAYKAGYKTIADISRERIRRAGEKIGKGDVGFKSYALKQSNYRQWQMQNQDVDEEALKSQMKMFIDQPLVGDCSESEVVHEIALKEGFGLNAVVMSETADGNSFWKVTEADRLLVVTFAPKITQEAITEIAKATNLTKTDTHTLVTLDSALTDSLKLNLSRNFNLKVI